MPSLPDQAFLDATADRLAALPGVRVNCIANVRVGWGVRLCGGVADFME
ncbi:hypothetical protein ACFYQA_07625 [Streptomyces sp. NPDC005774]